MALVPSILLMEELCFSRMPALKPWAMQQVASGVDWQLAASYGVTSIPGTI